MVQEQAQVDLNDGVWFHFDGQTDLATQGEYGGIRHTYRAGIGEVLKNIQKAQIINFDLGIGDPITPGPQPKRTLSLFSDTEDISWSVYPIETICAEKLHALISHGDENSRSKDVHDLAIFLPKADPKTLKKAIKNCFEFRETEIPTSFYEGVRQLNTSRLEKGLSIRDIEERTGIPKSTVREALTKSGMSLRNPLNGSARQIDRLHTKRGGHTPYGYAYLDGQLLFDPKEQSIVRKILKLHQSGMSGNAIATELNHQKIPSRTGKTWRPCVVRRIIKANQTMKK